MTEVATHEQTIYSYEDTYVAETDGKIIGAMCTYDGADHKRLKQPVVDVLGKDSMFGIGDGAIHLFCPFRYHILISVIYCYFNHPILLVLENPVCFHLYKSSSLLYSIALFI